MILSEIVDILRNLAVEYAPLLKGLAVGSALFFVITPILAPIFVVLMPKDALVRQRIPIWKRPPLKRTGYLLWHITKNCFGAVLMILGFLLLFLPGQGLLTMFAGVLLTDIPWRRALLVRLLGMGKVRPIVDRLRVRHGRRALIYPEEAGRNELSRH